MYDYIHVSNDHNGAVLFLFLTKPVYPNVNTYFKGVAAWLKTNVTCVKDGKGEIKLRKSKGEEGFVL